MASGKPPAPITRSPLEARPALRSPPARRCHARHARSRNPGPLVASPAKNSRSSKGRASAWPRRRAAGQGIAVGAADAGGPAPGGGDERPQAPPSLGAQQRRQLLDRVIEAGGQTALLDHSSAFSAEKTFDNRPAEWANRVGGRTGISRIAEDMSFGGERALPDNLQIELLIAAKRERACRLQPGIEGFAAARSRRR